MPYILDTTIIEPGAGLNDMLEELYARGYDHLSQDGNGIVRAKRMINQAYLEVVLEERWPFRIRTTSGVPPLDVTDLGDIISVVDTTNDAYPLDELQQEEWAYIGSDDATGFPRFYLRDANTVYVWPQGGNISVRHYAVPPYLATSDDETIVPLRYMDVIVDGAVRRAAKDRDDPDAVGLAEDERQRGLAIMRRNLLVPPQHVRYTNGSVDE